MENDMPDLTPAWSDLIEGLTLLAQHPTDTISPLHCEHDELTVLADPTAFTDEERARLADLGFRVGDGDECFYSFRFGSA